MEQVFCFNNKIKLRILFSFNSQFNLNELIGLQLSIVLGQTLADAGNHVSYRLNIQN